jgi:(1->4)-alpha-D-glucan 1-alpha-D-glucosylmutase
MSNAVAMRNRTDETAEAVVAQVEARRVRPTAVCRLQFCAEFTFHDAAAVVPYLHDLGISHVYASPITTARTPAARDAWPAAVTSGADPAASRTGSPDTPGLRGMPRVEDLAAAGSVL